MKYVLVTGTSTGIGFEIAKDLIENGFNVLGSVRKNEDSQRVKELLGSSFFPLIFDVTDFDAINKAIHEVKKIIGDECLTALINNAGIACPGPLLHVRNEEVSLQFNVNVGGVLNCVKAFFPFLIPQNNSSSRPGRIINISSVSGRLTFPFIGLYAASKHALESISDALRRELVIYGIDVIVLQPGNVQTPIWNKIPDFNQPPSNDYTIFLNSVIENLQNSRHSFIPVSKINKIIRKVLNDKKPKTRYTLVKNKFTSWTLPRLLPDRWLDRIIFTKLKLNNKNSFNRDK